MAGSDFHRLRICSSAALVAVTHAGCGGSAAGAEILRVNGSTTVNPIVAEAAEILHAERGLMIRVDTQGGSSGGISMLGEGLVQVGMSSKPLHDRDRARFPGVAFESHHVGEDAVALIVARDVWDAGVRSITRAQMRDVYEGRITSWRPLGGPDRRIVFFNKEPGRGTWEVFAQWLYGSADAAPAAHFPEVGSNEETRAKVASTPGALSQLSSSWVDDESVFALAIADDSGRSVAPTAANIAARVYPMSRPLFLLTAGPPTGAARTLIDFVLSDQGQAIVRRHGYLSLDELRR